MSITTATPTRSTIEYPESDGKPMAETDTHRKVMTDTIETLTDFFRDRLDVYVAGNLLLYYEEGHPNESVAPDVFVVKGVSKSDRRTYKLWEEGRAPSVVFEISSRSTRWEDTGSKRGLYATLGVREYFIFDPLAEYLKPPLQGYQLASDDYERVQPASDGALMSHELGLKLQGAGQRLRFIDATTGEKLLSPAELAEARRETERKLAEADAELARLRQELARLKGEQ